MRRLYKALLLFLTMWLSGQAHANCRLALVLAMDVSSSVSATEDGLQRYGTYAALTDPEVVDALLSQPGWDVALYVFQWSGSKRQDTILGWTMLDSEKAIKGAASAVANSARPRDEGDSNTATGSALLYAVSAMQNGPKCERYVIDISSDGKKNAGADIVSFDGITVNGLAIVNDFHDLESYFYTNVISGEYAFVETAKDFNDFTRVLTRKLVRETGTPEIGMLDDYYK